MEIRTNAAPTRGFGLWGWLAAAAALVLLRLPHLAGPIDDPHSWRQCDTAHASLDFYRRGIDLFHPAVAWMGAYRNVILEFPLTAAVISLLYRWFHPDVMWDRVVALACFVVAAAYVHAFVRRWAGPRPAWLATLAYLVLPLGMFYSRTAHVDFAASALAFAMLHHGARGCDEGSTLHTAIAAACGALAAMIKAPAVLPVVLPLAFVALRSATPGARARLVAIGAVTGATFAGWWGYVESVNRAAPDWSFLPGYYRGAQPPGWYFGSLADRLDPGNWARLGRRLVREIASPLGAVLALLALAPRPSPARIGPRAVALAWAAGAVVFLLVFIKLNLIHNYYSIPFLGPVAMMIGLGSDFVIERLPRVGPLPLGALAFVAFIALAAVMPQRLGYYRVDWLRVEAGRLIERRVPAGQLVVASDYGAGFTDPRLLVRADREGWSVAAPDLARDRVERLAGLGARWVAVVTDPAHPEVRAPGFLARGLAAREPVRHGDQALGTLEIYDLTRALGDDSVAARP